MSRRRSALVTYRDIYIAKKVIKGLIGLTITFIVFSFHTLEFFSKIAYRLVKKIYILIKYKHFEYSSNQLEKQLKYISPREFEILCGNMFKALGHKVVVTEATQDYGRDLILDNNTYVECKHYNEYGEPLGRVVLQKLVGSCVAFNIKHAIVVTTGRYHENAFEYAARVNKTGNCYIELWDKNDIIHALNKVEQNKIGFVLNYLEG
jgi:HJR/Mrr/RecB family endonuclease